MKRCDAASDNMVAYRYLYNALEGEFEGCELNHIGRESNEEADALANIDSTCAQVPSGVFFDSITCRSIKIKPEDSKPEERSGARSQDAAVVPATAEESHAVTIEQVLLIEPV